MEKVACFGAVAVGVLFDQRKVMTLGTAFLCVFDWNGDLIPDCDTGRCINSVTSSVNWELQEGQIYWGVFISYMAEDDYESEIEERFLFRTAVRDVGQLTIFIPPNKGQLSFDNIVWDRNGMPEPKRKVNWKQEGF